jgi:hypothetical protein
MAEQKPVVGFFCEICGLCLDFARAVVGSRAKIDRGCPVCGAMRTFLRGVFDA